MRESPGDSPFSVKKEIFRGSYLNKGYWVHGRMRGVLGKLMIGLEGLQKYAQQAQHGVDAEIVQFHSDPGVRQTSGFNGSDQE